MYRWPTPSVRDAEFRKPDDRVTAKVSEQGLTSESLMIPFSVAVPCRRVQRWSVGQYLYFVYRIEDHKMNLNKTNPNNSFGNLLPGVLALSLIATITINDARAQSPVKLNNYNATIDILENGDSVFELAGVASHLGSFNAYGEASFIPGPVAGSMLGEGVVVLEAANGDRLVGLASWLLGPAGEDSTLDTTFHFSWRDSVTFEDGSVVSNTGRFVNSRPPGIIQTGKLCCTTICLPFLGCFTRCELCPNR